MDPHILSPTLSYLDVLVTAMVWIAALAALAAACAMNSFLLICSLAIFFCLAVFLYFVYESAYLKLPSCSSLLLLKLSNLGVPHLLQSGFLRPFTHDTM